MAGNKNNMNAAEKKAKAKAKSKASPAKKSGRGAALNVQLELDDCLQSLLGKKKASRPQIVKGLWDYAKKNNLNQGRNITPDDKLAKFTGSKKTINGISMTKFISKHTKKNGQE